MTTLEWCNVKLACFLLFAATFLVLIPTCSAQLDPKPEDATAAVLHEFEKHNIVIFGEIHGNMQEYEWLRSLIATPEFADRVDDIVMEFGNSQNPADAGVLAGYTNRQIGSPCHVGAGNRAAERLTRLLNSGV